MQSFFYLNTRRFSVVPSLYTGYFIFCIQYAYFETGGVEYDMDELVVLVKGRPFVQYHPNMYSERPIQSHQHIHHTI